MKSKSHYSELFKPPLWIHNTGFYGEFKFHYLNSSYKRRSPSRCLSGIHKIVNGAAKLIFAGTWCGLDLRPIQDRLCFFFSGKSFDENI